VHAPSSPQDQFFCATMLPLITSSFKNTTCLSLCDILGFHEIEECSLNLHLADSTVKKPMGRIYDPRKYFSAAASFRFMRSHLRPSSCRSGLWRLKRSYVGYKPKLACVHSRASVKDGKL
ncbi:hypothetical protein ZWY2020_014252, partial [Hordeum vulgare]